MSSLRARTGAHKTTPRPAHFHAQNIENRRDAMLNALEAESKQVGRARVEGGGRAGGKGGGERLGR